MESYVVNGQIVTNLTTVSEGNSLIMRKGRTTLLSAKVMLFALLNVENRNDKNYTLKEVQYYDQLKKDTGVDYSKGIVSEIKVSDLRKLLKKEKSGSFYSSLKELFSIDPYESKSLRNSWAIMLPNPNSGVLGYAEVVTACHYKISDGRLFIKFNNEQIIKDQIFKGKEKCTELPFLYMCRDLKSLHSFRIFEILSSQVNSAENILREHGEPMPEEFSFKFSLGELQLMLGIIDLTIDKDGKKMAAVANPDYNKIAEVCNKTQAENMCDYRAFRRYSLTIAVNEINSLPSSPFTVTYDVERDGNNGRVSAVVFYVKNKNQTIERKECTYYSQTKKNNVDFIVDTARLLNDFSLTFDELSQIASASNYDIDLIKAARIMYDKMGICTNFANWFIEIRR